MQKTLDQSFLEEGHLHYLNLTPHRLIINDKGENGNFRENKLGGHHLNHIIYVNIINK